LHDTTPNNHLNKLKIIGNNIKNSNRESPAKVPMMQRNNTARGLYFEKAIQTGTAINCLTIHKHESSQR
jgi:hypothetical protein